MAWRKAAAAVLAVSVGVPVAAVWAQTAGTRPAAAAPPRAGATTRPASPATAAGGNKGAVDPNATLNRMLRPTAPTARPLQPLPADTPVVDATSGGGALAPAAPSVKLIREGTYVVDRIGRLRRSDDGQSQELVFDSDGQAMQDPPMVILQNLTLMQMENATIGARDRKFRVTGMVTEYRGRNCILLEKAVPVADPLRVNP